ncbi:MAG: hypothetical protein K8S16_03190 [Bacteroidales bacterium]|nr:hypothetical protein [Bacteroidales bacterium]
MIRITLLGLLILSIIDLHSQTTDVTVLCNEKNIGMNLISQKDIKAIEYIFPERVQDTYIDTTSRLLTIQLRGLSKNGKWLNNKGKIVLYDLAGQKVKWTKKMFYQTSSLQQFGKTMIHSVANKSYCLNIKNGENLWDVKNNIYFVDPIDNIGIGYKFKNSSGYTNTLEGINLSNGSVIWQRELNREYSWNDVFYLNDSIFMVVAAGLHAINIKDGTGWDYNTITGEKDYTGSIVANGVGAVLGVLTGTFVMSTGHDLVRGVVSNVIVDSSDLYFASKEKISRIDKTNGNVIWSYPLPDDLTGKSAIFIKDDLVYMVNEGYAFMGTRQLEFGTPFIAAFNQQTGKQIFFSIIKTKKNPILGFQIHGDTILLIFKERVTEYSMANGIKLFEIFFDTETYGELNQFVGNHVYVMTNDTLFKNLPLSDTTKSFILTNSGKTLVLDENLNITDKIDFEELFIYYLRTKDYKFIAKNNQTIILNSENKKIAEISATSNATLIGTKLYDIQEQSFIEIDLTELIEGE